MDKIIIKYIEKLEKAEKQQKRNHTPINYHSYRHANLDRALLRSKITKYQFDKVKADYEEQEEESSI